MANRTGSQSGLNAGNANAGTQQAQRRNSQAMKSAGQAAQTANYEFGTLGTTESQATTGTAQARQANQRAAKNAAAKAGRTGQ